jgi:tetratricopeptide (TPR) repeat protein
LDIRTPLKCGLACQTEGLLENAERCYQRVLSLQPRHFDALHMLDVVSIQNRRLDRAIMLLTKALKQNASIAAAHRNLALALAFLRCRLDQISGKNFTLPRGRRRAACPYRAG